MEVCRNSPRTCFQVIWLKHMQLPVFIGKMINSVNQPNVCSSVPMSIYAHMLKTAQF